MQILDRSLIYDASQAEPDERVASFTGLFRHSSGRLLCTFQLGPEKHAPTSSLGMCESLDNGVSWKRLPLTFQTNLNGTPGSLSSGEIAEIDTGHLMLYATWFDRRDPQRPLFDPETQGILHSRQLLAESHNGGQTWSDWRTFDIPGLSGCSATGPLIPLPAGHWGLPFESYKDFDDPTPATHGAWMMRSDAQGTKIEGPLPVAQHPEHRVYYWDQRLCAGTDPDEAIAMFWTHDLQLERDLNVHLLRLSLSRKEQTRPRDTGIPGQIAAPCVLPDGRLLAFVVDRSGPMTLSLWQSPDGGSTWPRELMLPVYEHDEQAQLSQTTTDVDYTEYWEDMARWSFGHPAVRPLSDSEVLLAWYAGTPGCLSIHGARIAVS